MKNKPLKLCSFTFFKKKDTRTGAIVLFIKRLLMRFLLARRHHFLLRLFRNSQDLLGKKLKEKSLIGEEN